MSLHFRTFKSPLAIDGELRKGLPGTSVGITSIEVGRGEHLITDLRDQVTLCLISEGANPDECQYGCADRRTECHLFLAEPIEGNETPETLIAKKTHLAEVVRILIARLETEELCDGNGVDFKLVA